MAIAFIFPFSFTQAKMLPVIFMEDSLETNNDTLPYPFDESFEGVNFSQPDNFNTNITYDLNGNNFTITNQVGDINLNNPTLMSQQEYQEYMLHNQLQEYWMEKIQIGGTSETSGRGGLLPEVQIGGEAFEKIFGGNTVNIKPVGSAELTFSLLVNKVDNPTLPVENRKTSSFNFDQKIQMSVTGSIGNKLKMEVNYDTEATFDFENEMKIEFIGGEDDIIKRIELGNVSLPISGTLITGAQSLFGVKGQFQFGKATLTTVYSEQKSESQVIDVEGGATSNDFELNTDDYEENRHFFLGQYFRDHYDEALLNLPIIASGVNINRIEVWVTNKIGETENIRNIVGLMDLGEQQSNNISIAPGTYSGPYTSNTANSLNPVDFFTSYPDARNISQINSTMSSIGPVPFQDGRDYAELENARQLSESEYTLNVQLGYISLNQSLYSDEVLAVAFQYTVNGQTYQVGEFSNDGIDAPDVLMVKLLKSTITHVNLPIWDLMMKNVYSIGGYQINQEDFVLNILYSNDESGTPMNFIPEGDISQKILLQVMNLDNLNSNNDPTSDGIFDFVEGVTINASNGRIIFPVVEPFGEHLRNQFTDPVIADKYVYDALYDSTKFAAQQMPEFNKFILQGEYKGSSGSVISLNAMNVPQGSVTVTAGGAQLEENVHYIVDYTLGSVTILDEGLIASGTPIQISLESNDMFNIQTKRFMGAHLDYTVNDNFNVEASILNLRERPLTEKVMIGEEPIANTIWGTIATYNVESGFLTKLVDKIPFIETKAPSSITIVGEFAQLIPGTPKIIHLDEGGTSYIDDFETSQTTIDVKSSTSWVLASTPQDDSLFPESSLSNDITYGFNRAKMAWYTIDPSFHRNNSITPDHIANDPDMQSNHYAREVLTTEIFPNMSIPNGQPTTLAIFDLAYYPKERGPYNFDVEFNTYSAGIDANGLLNAAETRWAGIMRKLETNDFETANIEFIEFWLMDPFMYDPYHTGGDLYFNLGNVSEDILKDSRKSFENGLPTSDIIENVDTTAWGRVPTTQAVVLAFDNTEGTRPYQDIGLDGMNDDDEQNFHPNGDTSYPTYLERLSGALGTGSTAYSNALEDPSGDNYHYFRGSDYDSQELSITDRYKMFNGLDGNSPTADESPESYPTSATSLPDAEDINNDQTLSKTESYYQYKVSLRPEDLRVGQNYITDSITVPVTLQNNNVENATWYQFKIPIFNPEKVVGGISDFRSIRFMRMFMKNFEDPSILRFATLDLVRGDWRRYEYSLEEPQEGLEQDLENNTVFDISAVNIEENGTRTPISYTLPPGIDREIMFGTTDLMEENEQSISLKVCNLEDGDARGAFKNLDLDMRTYKRLKMFVHAESSGEEDNLNDGDISAFIRLGSDNTSNYYQYEVPLKVTPWGSTDEETIWPIENEFDLEFASLQTAKQERNDAIINNPDVTYQTHYVYEGSVIPDGHKITIVGSPSLGNIKTIMIGVKNPKDLDLSDPSDDGEAKCAEVWMNELRLADFDERGGWAANARVVTQLADFGTVTVAGSMSSIGFGSLEKNVLERNQEFTKQYDVSTSFELGKFFPVNAKIKIPFYYSLSEELSNPQFNPLDPDIELSAALEAMQTQAERDSIKYAAQNYTKRKSLNFTNIRKEKSTQNQGGGKEGKGGKRKNMPRIYDIENFSLSYSYNETFMRDINTEYNFTKTHTSSLNYSFNKNPKNYKPFSKIKVRSKYFRIIKDFNLYLVPSRITFRTDLDRSYNETLLRNTGDAYLLIDPTFNKSFTLDRIFDVKYDLSRALKVDFSATSNAWIDEPEGRLDTQEKMDTLWNNFLDLGRPISYNHTFNVNYTLPINKIPITDWITATSRYTSNYDWTGASLAAENLGNTIQNSRNIQLTGQTNMTTLYNKIGFLKRINDQNRRPPMNAQGKNNRNQKQRNPQQKNQQENKNERDKEEKEIPDILKYIGNFIMSLKTMSLTYSVNEGIVLPGFMPQNRILGFDQKYGSGIAPTAGFLFGSQADIRPIATQNDWITHDTLLYSQYSETYSNTLSFRSTVEPIQGLRLNITANRNYSNNLTEYFKDTTGFGTIESVSPITSGSFSMSFFSLGTMFEKYGDDYDSESFNQFLNNRNVVAQNLYANHYGYFNPNDPSHVDSTGFPVGYGSSSQEVLVTAFLAAYSGKNASNYNLNKFPKMPAPNWDLTYDGLMKIKWIKDRFRSVTLSHAYRSTYSMSSFATNLTFIDVDKDGYDDNGTLDLSGNFIPELLFTSMTISEQLSPLIRVDLTLKNSLNARIEIKKDRNLTFNFSNNQLTEVKGKEIIIGTGYTIKDLEFVFRSGGRQRNIKSDLDLRLDFSISDNVTLIRDLEDPVLPTAGSRLFSLKFTADYMISSSFNISLFYDRTLSSYVQSTSYPTANTNAGISARFSIQ